MTETRTRKGKPLNLRIPEFVHADLARLRDEVEATTDMDRPSEPRVVAALIHAALIDDLVDALRKYKDDLRGH